MRIGYLVVMAAMAFCDCEGWDDDHGEHDRDRGPRPALFQGDAGIDVPGQGDPAADCGVTCDPYTGECWDVPCAEAPEDPCEADEPGCQEPEPEDPPPSDPPSDPPPAPDPYA
jgi:hypothetical protein